MVQLLSILSILSIPRKASATLSFKGSSPVALTFASITTAACYVYETLVSRLSCLSYLFLQVRSIAVFRRRLLHTRSRLIPVISGMLTRSLIVIILIYLWRQACIATLIRKPLPWSPSLASFN